jgi:hypothetical protein
VLKGDTAVPDYPQGYFPAPALPTPESRFELVRRHRRRQRRKVYRSRMAAVAEGDDVEGVGREV